MQTIKAVFKALLIISVPAALVLMSNAEHRLITGGWVDTVLAMIALMWIGVLAYISWAERDQEKRKNRNRIRRECAAKDAETKKAFLKAIGKGMVHCEQNKAS